jgi:hypothetical protein
MKEKELNFAKTLLKAVENQPYKFGSAIKYSGDKQLMYYLEKWTAKGFWEFGVSLRTGWFTPEGIEHFQLALKQSERL